MNTRIVHRHPSWLVLAALLCALVTTPARSDVLMKDAPADEGSTTVANANWEALAVSSAKSRIESDESSLSVVLAQGDRASFSRAADLTPEPSAVLVTFNISLSDLGMSRATTQVFRLGWDFGGSVGDESDARTYARLGVTAAGSKYKLVDLMGGNTSPAFDGTQAVSWAVNNSGRTYSYSAPDGSIETLANDRMDVWVGRRKVLDEVVVTNATGRMTDLKWSWSQGSGVTRFDHFEVRTLEEATSVASRIVDPVAAPNAAVDPAAETNGDAIPLGRPTPNPFLKTMRFAYAIASGPAPVDIGVFDLAGRRIRTLAHGNQSTGRYEVRWDGLGDEGGQVKYGVYFLRAQVGTNARVSRIVYLSR
jgi:hypothetical protein